MGSLSCLAKSKLTTLYHKHYPQCIHKIPSKQLIQVNNDLINSYVDDLHIRISLKDVENEINEPTFSHEQNFNELRLVKQAEKIVISKVLKVLHVLDFTGFAIKKFHSTSLFIQNTLNLDDRLQVKQVAHTDIRPDQNDLKTEILSKRQKSTTYANCEDPDHPIITDDIYHYLGMSISQSSDRMFLCSKPIMLRSRIKGQIDTILQNRSEFNTYLN